MSKIDPIKKDPYFYLIIATLLVWFAFGSPGDTLARLFFMQSSAPWERVDGYFFPSRADREFVEQKDLSTLINCRRWAIRMATQNGDPRMQKSDYRCGIGIGEIDGYRILIQ